MSLGWTHPRHLDIEPLGWIYPPRQDIVPLRWIISGVRKRENEILAKVDSFVKKKTSKSSFQTKVERTDDVFTSERQDYVRI